VVTAVLAEADNQMVTYRVNLVEPEDTQVVAVLALLLQTNQVVAVDHLLLPLLLTLQLQLVFGKA
jgi:hypothetical protein